MYRHNGWKRWTWSVLDGGGCRGQTLKLSRNVAQQDKRARSRSGLQRCFFPWLLCLALTCLTLALGCLMDIARAGIVVATAWVVLVLAPLKDAAVIAPSTTAVWLLVTAAAVALMFVRRDRMGRGVAR